MRGPTLIDADLQRRRPDTRGMSVTGAEEGDWTFRDSDDVSSLVTCPGGGLGVTGAGPPPVRLDHCSVSNRPLDSVTRVPETFNVDREVGWDGVADVSFLCTTLIHITSRMPHNCHCKLLFERSFTDVRI